MASLYDAVPGRLCCSFPCQMGNHQDLLSDNKFQLASTEAQGLRDLCLSSEEGLTFRETSLLFSYLFNQQFFITTTLTPLVSEVKSIL